MKKLIIAASSALFLLIAVHYKFSPKFFWARMKAGIAEEIAISAKSDEYNARMKREAELIDARKR